MYLTHRPTSRKLELGVHVLDGVSRVRDLKREDDVAACLGVERSGARTQHQIANESDIDLDWHDQGRCVGPNEVRLGGDYSPSECTRRNPDCDSHFLLSGADVDGPRARSEDGKICLGNDHDFDVG